MGGLSFFIYVSRICTVRSGYETDERSSLGKRPDRRRWREEGGARSAAVYIFKAALPAAENIGYRKPGCRTNFEKPFSKAQIDSSSRNYKSTGFRKKSGAFITSYYIFKVDCLHLGSFCRNCLGSTEWNSCGSSWYVVLGEMIAFKM